MKASKFIFIFVFLPFISIYSGQHSSYIHPNPYHKLERTGESMVNWSQGYALAWGKSQVNMDADNILQSRHAAEKKAIELAMNDLANVLLKVRVDAYKTIFDYIAENREFAVLFNKYIHDYSLKLMPLTQGYTLVKSGVVFHFFGKKSLLEVFFEALKNEPVQRVPLFRNHDHMEVHNYTGLVIDARGLGFKPSIFPSIYVNDSRNIRRTIFSFHHLNRERSLQSGGARYTTTPFNVYMDKHVGPKPYICSAERVGGEFNTDIFISREDAVKFLSSTKTSKKLEEGRVLIIVDR